jgi:acylphosphatase
LSPPGAGGRLPAWRVSSVLLFVLKQLATIVASAGLLAVSKRQDFSMIRLPSVLFVALLVAFPAVADQKQAISATVTGDDQQVGFRAMVMKQAIEYNLAGFAKNENNEIVRFTLQGDPNRLKLAIATIREGTKKSSNIEVSTVAAAVDPALDTFTVVNWTSSSRNITTPYTLVLI